MPFEGLTSQPTVHHSVLARGIVTGRPRLAKSEAKGRLGETHRRILLSRDGGSSRARRPERPGRKATDDRVMNGAVAASMTYGGRDRLESITVGTPTVTFKVNALGQRVQKATTGATTDYLFDLAGHVIGEANDSTGSTTVEYVYMEGELLAQIDSSGNIYYAHNSQVSAAQKLTNASRTLVFDRIQEPFGEDSSTPTNTDPTNHRFPGQYADAEDLLNQNNNREYDPTLGYIEADPSGFRGGLNLYAYARQNPTQWTDPRGLLASMCGPGVPCKPQPDIGGDGPIDPNDGNTSGAPLIENKNEFACEVVAGLPCKLLFGEEPPALVRCDLYASGACVLAFGLEDGEAPYGKMCTPPSGDVYNYDPLSSVPPAPGSYSPIPSPAPTNPATGSYSPIPTTQ